MNVSQLQSSVLIIQTLGEAIKEYFHVLREQHLGKNEVIYSAVSSQILIMACSFKEELKVFGGLDIERERIMKVGAIIKPFKKRLDGWTDLERVRNTFFAHNFRDRKDGNSCVLLKVHNDTCLKMPNGFFDYILLCGCVDYIRTIILAEFAMEFSILAPIISEIKAPKIMQGFSAKDDALKELQDAIDESRALR